MLLKLESMYLDVQLVVERSPGTPLHDDPQLRRPGTRPHEHDDILVSTPPAYVIARVFYTK